MQEAKNYAMRLLSGRAYTKKTLCEKITARFDEESAEAAVTRMEELGLINDADYARRYAADCLNLKRYSLRRTAQALHQKGIDRHIIEDTLAEMEFAPEQSVARLLERKYPKWQEDEKNKTRAVNALVRLGYGYGDIRTVMQNLQEDPEYYEEVE